MLRIHWFTLHAIFYLIFANASVLLRLLGFFDESIESGLALNQYPSASRWLNLLYLCFFLFLFLRLFYMLRNAQSFSNWLSEVICNRFLRVVLGAGKYLNFLWAPIIVTIVIINNMHWSNECSKITLFITALLTADIACEVNLRIRILLFNTTNFCFWVFAVAQTTCYLD